MLSSSIWSKLRKVHRFLTLNVVGFPFWIVRHVNGSEWFVMKTFSIFQVPFVTAFFGVNEPYYNKEDAERILEFLKDGKAEMISSS